MDFAAWTQFDCQPIQGLLAQRLLAKAPGLERVFFCSSGTEAVESALKFARHATGKGRIVYARHGFHGLTAGSLSVNGAEEFKEGFGPLLPGAQIPLGDLGALEAELRKGDVAALIVEPVQGHGVMLTTPPGSRPRPRRCCTPRGALLICDEVQVGLGRTGRFFSYQYERRPAGHRHRRQGAVRRLRSGWRDADHGQDLLLCLLLDGQGHGPLDDLQGRTARHGRGPRRARRHRRRGPGGERGAARRRADARPEGLAAKYDLIKDVRGKGLIIGIEFGRPSGIKARAGWAMLQKARVGLFAQMVVVALFQRHRI